MTFDFAIQPSLFETDMEEQEYEIQGFGRCDLPDLNIQLKGWF